MNKKFLHQRTFRITGKQRKHVETKCKITVIKVFVGLQKSRTLSQPPHVIFVFNYTYYLSNK